MWKSSVVLNYSNLQVVSLETVISIYQIPIVLGYECDLSDEFYTRKMGAVLATILQPGDVVALYGNLGAGKTTLVRGLVQQLCGESMEVPSPTYTLVQTYSAKNLVLWHFDLYRIESPSELDELGWEDTEEAVMLIEWPERAGVRLPETRLEVILANSSNGGRRVVFVSDDKVWEKRFEAINFAEVSRIA